MSKNNQITSAVEKELQTLYQTPQPSEKFLEMLEFELTAASQDVEQEQATQSLFGQFKNLFQARWVQTPAMIAIILAIVITAIGPQKVIAQVQVWFNYVPGYGFVDLNATRLLVEPVSLTQGDMTVTVKQVLSNREGTYVSLNVVGGPDAKAYLEALGPVSEENYDEWIVEYQDLYENSANLILPDGSVMDDYYFQGAYWDGFLSFEILPQAVLDLSLELPRIPGLPAGEAPENWLFDLSLVYVEEEQIEALPTPQVIDVSSNTIQGINLRVMDTVYSDSEVALRVWIEGMPVEWRNNHPYLDASLSDDLGNQYPVLYEPASGLSADGSYLLTFQSIRPEASQLTLNVINLAFNVPLSGQSIRVDLGDAPQVGDHFTLDATVEAMGIPVHFSGLRIHDEKLAHIPKEDHVTTFEFEIDPIQVQDNIAITGLEISHKIFNNNGNRYGSSGSSGMDPELPGFMQTSLSFSLTDEIPLPNGNFEILFQAVNIYLDGPFIISWEIN